MVVGRVFRPVEYYVHGRGRGHASRCPAILRALLAAGYQARVYAGGQAAELLRDSSELEQVIARAPLLPSPSAPLKLVFRAAQDTRRLLAARPALIVSDGDQAALLAARALGIPSLVVGHDQIFRKGVVLPDLPEGPLRAQRLNGLPTRVATLAVAVHFLPVQSTDARIRVARPEVVVGQEVVSSNGTVVCYFRDENGLPLMRALRDLGHEVLWFGTHAKSEPGIVASPFSGAAFRAALRHCEAVVSSAGSNVMAECVLLKKPILALYTPRDSEQLLNAYLGAQAQVAVSSIFADAPGRARRFMQRVQSREFAQVDLEQELPPLSQVLQESLTALRDHA